ncbi:eukaryotic translation initiation factor 3 subunit B-like isoform X1 [Acyrthosiphon pisum]|uniref:RRM domain-containing protein n=1 Tax=Acyrthosiphon pisum TaxID=7029 RepID=A0A8R2F8M1_ACYPI|nr:eukaryotic translation initiation factor 3 subunit B-like isoform X1 [Acyrthosiphon pisum]|eukprot:XP_008183669.1 PREDICTED: eukaryotic translation initiation factor 3 subunit B-like isoform X2 [Acyrthosiphon pisum]
MAVADDAVDNKLLTSELTVDNKIDEVLLNLVLQKKLEVSTVIKVDGIPKTEPKTFDRLQRVITKIFTQFGKIPRVYYPKSEKGDTKGYLFIEYEEHESALRAVKRANNSRFCELTLLVHLVSDCKTIATLLQPIPSYNEPHSSSTPTTYHQYHVNKSLYIRIQDWMNNVPHIPDLEKRKMIAEAQLAMVKNKVSKKC